MKRKMITGCLLPLFLFFIFFAGLAFLFSQRLEPALLGYVSAGVGALLLSLILGAFTSLFQATTLTHALRRAQQNKPPRAGKWSAVTGQAVAKGQLLTSPFSEKPCLSYEYELSRTTRTFSAGKIRIRKTMYIFGLGRTAYAIRTEQGDIGPMGTPTLDQLPKESRLLSDKGNQDLLKRTEEFLRRTSFQDAAGLGRAVAFSQMIGAMEADHEVIRMDWKVREPGKLAGTVLHETCLQPGTQLSAVGTWDEKCATLRAPITLIMGDLAQAKRTLVGKKLLRALIVLLLCLPATVLLLKFAFGKPQLSEAARPYRHEPFKVVVESAPPEAILEICRRNGHPDQADSFGTPPLFWTRDAEKLQALLDCGADPNQRNREGDTRLSQAAAEGDVASVRILLQAGADLEAELPGKGRGWTAMVSAYTEGRSEVVELLARAGAVDERVSATSGIPLGEDSAPMAVVRAYLAAIHAGDLAGMQRLRPDKSQQWFEQIDFAIWQPYYPAEAKLSQAFGNTRAATLELAAHMVRNQPLRHFFHLEYQTGAGLPPQWVILREWTLL